MSIVGTGGDETDASEFRVGDDDAGRRLDQFLAAALGGELSRSRLQSLIEDGQVRIDETPVLLPKRKVAAGETVRLDMPEPEAPEPVAEDIPLDILYEDEHLVVLDKPAGLVVHPGPGNWTGTLVNALLFHCGDTLSGIGGVKRPGIVHRLDKDTSGVMVVAKSDAAHRSLAAQFAAHGQDGRMERAYQAVVWGVPARPVGTVEAALGRSNSDRTKRQVVPDGRPDARHAVTHFEVLERFGSEGANASLIACILETGRTHQIRVHMSHIGHPLIGDDVYGAHFRTKSRKLGEVGEIVAAFPRQALHAFRLAFEHPVTGEPMAFETELPEDMQELLEALARLPA
ncbi:RluA family pseudouridine synthase [Aureimonas flava]|uniref:Pseudouridine synthase n=1 Tax=Aureimonas flava TaxID=2320271 RepID=A0A3A1WGK8_9HYPH|nr:RluA family pseudouridine synthase [Aureimonas flava]RIX98728.1 RluA family pseudouridine synthase [Aureimonas flava]